MTRAKRVRVHQPGTEIFHPTRASIRFIRELNIPPNAWQLFADSVEAAPDGDAASRFAHNVMLEGIEKALSGAIQSHASSSEREVARLKALVHPEPNHSEQLAELMAPPPAANLVRQRNRIVIRFTGTEAQVRTLWEDCLLSLDIEEQFPHLEPTGEDQAVVSVPNDPAAARGHFRLPARSRLYEKFVDGLSNQVYSLGGDLFLPSGQVIVMDDPIWTALAGKAPLSDADLDRHARSRAYGYYPALRKTLWDDASPETCSLVLAYWRRMLDLPARHIFHTALFVLHAWEQQRDAWAQRLISLPNYPLISTGEDAFIVIDPAALWRWISPGRAHHRNWRTTVTRLLETMQLVTRSRGTYDILSYHGLLSNVVDGRMLSAYGRPKSVNLRESLAKAGIEGVDAIFIQIHPTWKETMMPHFKTSDGNILWGHKAKRKHHEHWRTSSSGTDTKQRKISEFNDRLKISNYITVDPVALVFAKLRNWGIGKTWLLLAMLMEQSPPADRRRRTTKRSAKAAIPPPAGYTAHNGSHGHGYSLQQWLKKAGYPADRIGLGRFLVDLRVLHDEIGVELLAKDYPEWSDFEDVCAHIIHADRAGRRWQKRVFQVFFPSGWVDELRARLREAGAEWPDANEAVPEESLDSSATWLAIERRIAGLSGKDLAQALGVSASMVSRWERGHAPIPEKHRVQLEELFAESRSGHKDYVQNPSGTPSPIARISSSLTGDIAG